ncbi:AI-2E family transporter, partial [Mycobacterium kansasii]
TPLFTWFNKRLSTGLSATCTVLTALASVFIPVALLVALAVVQVARMVDNVAEWFNTTDPSELGDKVLRLVNDLLARVPFLH